MEIFLFFFSMKRKCTSDSLQSSVFRLQTLRRIIMDSDVFNCRKLEPELFVEATDDSSKHVWLPLSVMM